MQLSPEEWVAWKQHPTTVKFLGFLRDRREQIGAKCAAIISSGVIPSQEFVTDAAKRCDELHGIENLDHADIVKFYEPQREEEENGTATEPGKTGNPG